jgi:uncharacterized phiE125 gp8 family phage protein
MNPQTTVTAKSSDLPVTLEEAKTHLRLLSSDLDEHVASLLEAAVEYCETVCGRSLRVSHALTQSYDGWPIGLVRFDRNPVTAVSHVKYYDADDTLTTVSTSDYRLHLSSEAAAVLEFDADFTLPTLSDRSDAVIVTYTAGYATLADVPHRAKAAINMKLAELFGNLDERMVAPNERAIASLLGTLDWGCYR